MFNKGDSVECINSLDTTYRNPLTLGKVYNVIKGTHDNGSLKKVITVLNNNGREETFFEERFKNVTLVPKEFFAKDERVYHPKFGEGRVLVFNPIIPSYLVEFDKEDQTTLHNGNCGLFLGKDYHCWYCKKEELVKVPEISPKYKFKIGDEVICTHTGLTKSVVGVIKRINIGFSDPYVVLTTGYYLCFKEKDLKLRLNPVADSNIEETVGVTFEVCGMLVHYTNVRNLKVEVNKVLKFG
jgi:hypothetical protein